MLSMLLALQLASSAAEVEEARLDPRLRGAVSLIGTAGVGFRTGAFGAGPGLSAELGALFGDRTSIVARLTVGTLIFIGVAMLGGGVDYALSDHWSLGAGLALVALGNGTGSDLPSAIGGAVPLRVVFTPGAREPQQLRRRGFAFSFEVSPGVAPFGSAGFRFGPVMLGPPFLVVATLGVGYQWS
jgi:hypothetical protein